MIDNSLSKMVFFMCLVEPFKVADEITLIKIKKFE